MKICDRCYESNGDAKPAVEKVDFLRNGSGYDLCQSCAEDMMEFISKKPEVPVEPERTVRKTRKTKKNKP